jgi:hypothetical protein
VRSGRYLLSRLIAEALAADLSSFTRVVSLPRLAAPDLEEPDLPEPDLVEPDLAVTGLAAFFGTGDFFAGFAFLDAFLDGADFLGIVARN